MKNLLKRVMSIAAATALLMTSVISAEAADPDADKTYTITITAPSDGDVETGNLPDNLYAFQILSGTVPDNKVEGKYENPGTYGNSLPITDIKWGSGINTDLLDKLIETLSNSKHIGHYFTDLKTASDDGASEDELALLFAEAISVDGFGTRQNMQYLADILGGFKADGETATTNYLLNSSAIAMNKDTTDGITWTAKVKAGYYLIKSGTETDTTDSAYSARMLFVASNVTQRLKESVPFFHKYIVREDVTDDTVTGNLSETDVAGVGDIVNFQLKGTLPTNYDKYVVYKYTFNDTLSHGLDVVDYADPTTEADHPTVLVKVKGLFKNVTDSVTNPEEQKGTVYDYKTEVDDTPSYWKWDSDIVLEIPAENYNTSWSTADNKFSVEFSDLKKIELKVSEAGKEDIYKLGFLFDAPGLTDHTHNGKIDEEHSSKIMVNYKAKVNKNAIVGSTGNINTASLTYSNNPQNEENTGTSTEDTAKVYVFGLDIIKVDAGKFLKDGYVSNEESVGLAGAKFAVVRPVKDDDGNITSWEIAKFEKVTAPNEDPTTLPTTFNTNGYYSIVSWEDIDIAADEDKSTFKNSWISSYTTDDYNIETSVKGILNISGLDAGVTYTMVETATPTPADKYAKIEPFTITLEAAKSGDEYTGKLSSATSEQSVAAGKSFSYDKPVQITDEFGADDDGSANMLVANFKYTDLPSTGGIGVYIYYIAGGCVVALALVLFALSKKKKTTK